MLISIIRIIIAFFKYSDNNNILNCHCMVTRNNMAVKYLLAPGTNSTLLID